MSEQTIEILMVEDSESDIRLAQIALDKAKLVNNVNVVRDGKSALLYLRKEGIYADAVTPDIILLDLNLPKLNGHEVLREIRKDDALKLTPVVVLTTSDADEDVAKSYNLSANCYITKPVDLPKFMEVVQAIEHFWVKIVRLPPKDR